MAVPLEVVELSAGERAVEHPADQEYERDGEGNEEIEAFHGAFAGLPARRASASEFRATMSELPAIPSAASQGPIQPSVAAGSASTL